MLYGENVENLCMWKVASEKKPFIDFLRNGIRARFFPHIFRDDDNDERQNFLWFSREGMEKRGVV